MECTELKGFLESKRELGGLTFVVLRLPTTRDLSQERRVQLVVRKKELLVELNRTPLESYLWCKGLSESNTKSSLKSYILEDLLVETPFLGVSPVVFSKSNLRDDLDYLEDPFYLKDPLVHRTLVLRAVVLSAIRAFLDKKGFVELTTPKLVDFGSEGGAQIYKVKGPFSKKDFYLVQSPQIYKQLAVNAGLKGVYQIGPIFRAEKFKTSRHANQTLCLDLEMGSKSLKQVLLLLRDLLIHVGGDTDLKDTWLEGLQKSDFKLITYKKAIKMLSLEDGAPLETAHQFELVSRSNAKFLFVVGYPPQLRTFYTKGKLNFDILTAKAELCSGCVREGDYETLCDNLSKWNISKDSLPYYLESFKKGPQRSVGFGLGLDRLFMLILDKKNIEMVKVFRNEQI